MADVAPESLKSDDQHERANPGVNGPNHSNNPTVRLTDTVGAIVLGVISLVVLIAWMREVARNRRLEAQLNRCRDRATRRLTD